MYLGVFCLTFREIHVEKYCSHQFCLLTTEKVFRFGYDDMNFKKELYSGCQPRLYESRLPAILIVWPRAIGYPVTMCCCREALHRTCCGEAMYWQRESYTFTSLFRISAYQIRCQNMQLLQIMMFKLHFLQIRHCKSQTISINFNILSTFVQNVFEFISLNCLGILFLTDNMKVKEIERTANVAWSPAKQHPVYLAAGTAAQQLDATFRFVYVTGRIKIKVDLNLFVTL